jgi:hypothetical protein
MFPTFACPSCSAVLNPNKRIIFVVEHEGRRAIVLLSSHLDEFLSICEESFGNQVKEGHLVRFLCPVCHTDLAVPGDNHFAEILEIVPDREPRRVRFSTIRGEHATFVIDKDGVMSFGEHAALYKNLDFSDTDRWW